MPALVVWEPLIAAGDDLYLLSILRMCLYMAEFLFVTPITYFVVKSEHDPIADCASDDTYHNWRMVTIIIGVCMIILTVIGCGISLATCQLSQRGTPTDTAPRRLLIPLCKFNMVPFLLAKFGMLVLGIIIAVFTDNYCNCVRDSLGVELTGRNACPAERQWFGMVRTFLTLFAADVFVSSLRLFCCILRTRVSKCRLWQLSRPQREIAEEDHYYRWWQRFCQRSCELSSILTCYIFGGQRIDSARYVDIAIALTTFFEDGGALDIVPSDVAAALVCLTIAQRKKRIECRNELLKQGGGIYAKDKKFLGKLWSNMKASSRQLQEQKQLSRNKSFRGSCVDIEAGMNEEKNSCSESTANQLNHHQDKDETIVESQNIFRSHTLSSNDLTDKELADARALLDKSANEIMSHVVFREQHEHGEITFRPTLQRLLVPEREFDRQVLSEGARYSRVALAAYSWMMYLWTSRCGCCKLSATTLTELCMCQPRYCRSKDHVNGDNWCGWKETSVLKSLGIEEKDFIFANFRNDVNVCPYMIIIDRKYMSILIVIRGTLSFEDMISDVTISPRPLDDVGQQYGFDGTGEYCHSGILEAAKYLYDDMEARNVLKNALKDHANYNVKIVGHSLGAGVAAMLGLMMKKEYPLLKCLCFCPPGCVLTKQMAERSKAFVWSYVLHNDTVPRLSYHSLVNLRNDVIEMIARIKVPKHQVFRKKLRFRNETELQDLPSKLLHDKESIPQSTFFDQFSTYIEQQKGRVNALSEIRLVCPGNICQLYRTSERFNSIPCEGVIACLRYISAVFGIGKTDKYTVRWTTAEDLSEICISSTMMVDHFPYNITRALQVAAESVDLLDISAGETETDKEK